MPQFTVANIARNFAILFTTFTTCFAIAGKNRLIDTDTSKLVIVPKRLDELTKDPAKAADWKVTSVELFLMENVHLGIKLVTEHPPNLLYHMDQTEEIRSFNDDKFPDRFAYISAPVELLPDGTYSTKEFTLGRLIDCVIPPSLIDYLGKCFVFALRVMRFAAGGCVCGECARSEGAEEAFPPRGFLFLPAGNEPLDQKAFEKITVDPDKIQTSFTRLLQTVKTYKDDPTLWTRNHKMSLPVAHKMGEAMAANVGNLMSFLSPPPPPATPTPEETEQIKDTIKDSLFPLIPECA